VGKGHQPSGDDVKLEATVKNEIGELRTVKTLSIELPDDASSSLIDRELARLKRHTSGEEIIGEDEIHGHA
jgi:hypothetical protein